MGLGWRRITLQPCSEETSKQVRIENPETGYTPQSSKELISPCSLRRSSRPLAQVKPDLTGICLEVFVCSAFLSPQASRAVLEAAPETGVRDVSFLTLSRFYRVVLRHRRRIL